MKAWVRQLPAPRPAAAPRAESLDAPAPHNPAALVAPPPRPQPAAVAPLASERYKIQFTVSRETYEKLRRAQHLLRHVVPNGDLAAIFDRALTLLLAEVERTKLAATGRPRGASARPSSSRHVPAAVKREVWARDGGQCAFVGTKGRCGERGFLEFHHVVPYAAGGRTTTDSIQLRCRAHNAHEAEEYFGPRQPPLVRETAMVF